MKEININLWGVKPTNSSAENTRSFTYFFDKELTSSTTSNPLTLNFGSGTYAFDLLEIGRSYKTINNLHLKGVGIGKTILKFSGNEHTFLYLHHLTNFIVSDLSINGAGAKFEGGLWVRESCRHGIVERVEVYDAHDVSCVVSGPDTSHITIRDCTVYNQRNFTGNSKAMFLAGDTAEFVTFENCHTFSQSKDKKHNSVADHFDTDDAKYVNYLYCTANGEGSQGGVGFWNEGEGEGIKAISTYYGCTAYKTHGGLATSENSVVKAYGMNFIQCSAFGWTVWSKGLHPHSSLSLDGGYFKGCGSAVTNNRDGGIHVEANTHITNCIFEDTPDGCFNISFYKFGAALPPDTYTYITNCVFDKGVRITCPYLNDGPSIRNLTIQNSIFKPHAYFAALQNPLKYNIRISGCTFFDKGLVLENVNKIKILGNTFTCQSDEITPIERMGMVSGIVQDNLFSGYKDTYLIFNDSKSDQRMNVYFNDYE